MKQISNSKLAPTPPMGWNSWDCYGLDVNEKEVKENADFIAKELKQYGWEYVVIDMGWYAPNVSTKTYKQPNIPMIIDEYGRLIPVPERFPSSVNGAGFAPIAEYIHSLGLKFGIHIMRGMPWISSEKIMPVKGSDVKCNEISDKSDMCLWYNSMYGIDCTKKGAQEYYDSLIELYTEWGVDFIKADDMGTWDGDGLNSPMRTDELEMLANSIEKFGNKIVLSISPGAAYVGNAAFLSRHAHMWRISCDFWDNWQALKRQFPRCAHWAKRKIYGHWPDADMLPLGKIGIRGEIGQERDTNFTQDEQVTLMTLWSIFRSPLMFGGDLLRSDSSTIALITNKNVLQVNQNSKGNKEIYNVDDIVVWEAMSNDDEYSYYAIFNLSDELKNLNIADFGIKYKDGLELWTNETMNEFVSINPHACVLIRYSK